MVPLSSWVYAAERPKNCELGHTTRVITDKIIERSIFHFIWQYSRRDQLVLLVVTVSLFPLLYLTLELPKRIINDAIGAANPIVNIGPFQVEQVSFLMILCVGFLLAVLAHGLLKMRINTMKGVLSERMLRRFRYQLISRAIWFPRPYFERTSQGELVSMITAETEPMGGLMGDAISQPVLQAGQMMTILFFLFLQSAWFGLAAIALIPLQAWLIPRLQKQINLLNKDRIKEVRQLAAMIGENAAGASALRRHGGWRYRLSMMTEQLGVLYQIRFRIYQKKFFMKFINNFITQLTPFLFYSIGGLLVLQGSVSLGALVAALAAYKDLSSPWKELLTYYNQTQDLSVRWQILIEKFAPADQIDEKLVLDPPDEVPHLNGDIGIDHVTVRDADGAVILDDISAILPQGGVIGIAAPAEEDRMAISELLSREMTPTTGRVTVGEADMADLHQAVIAARIGVATSRPVTFRGTFGDNVLMAVRTRPQDAATDAVALAEADRAGNSTDPFDTNWVDLGLAGLTSEAELRAWWLQLIKGMGSSSTLFQRGLDQEFDPEAHADLADRLIALRPRIRDALVEAGLRDQVFRFKPDIFNDTLPVFENLLFATPRAPITADLMESRTEFFTLLAELNLVADLVQLSRDVLEMLRGTFGRDGVDHPLFRRLGLDAGSYEAALELMDRTRGDELEKLTPRDLAQLGIVAFRIKAMDIGAAFPTEVKARIVDLRNTHGAALRAVLEDVVSPLDPDTFAVGQTVLENALFGRIYGPAVSKIEDIRRLVTDILVEEGVEDLVIELIYDVPIGLGGTNLPAVFAEPLSLSRATIKRPDILIMEQSLKSYELVTKRAVHLNLRGLMPEATIIYIDDAFEYPDVFDVFLEVKDGRLVSDEVSEGAESDNVVSADLQRKLRALQQSSLFSGLDRRQLRLLAFGARWYEAEAGETVFLKGDEPTDGAYMMIKGEAGLYLPQEGEEDRLIATVTGGQLVGELGLIRKVPRALSMVAKTDITCLRIGEEEFLAVVENDASTAFKLLQVVAGYVSN